MVRLTSSWLCRMASHWASVRQMLPCDVEIISTVIWIGRIGYLRLLMLLFKICIPAWTSTTLASSAMQKMFCFVLRTSQAGTDGATSSAVPC